MTILRSILERGYFPKELPPAFFTEAFAAYASTKKGRAAVNDYKASDGFSECVRTSAPGRGASTPADSASGSLREARWPDLEELQEVAREGRVAVLEEPSNLQRRPVPGDQSKRPPIESHP